MAHRSTTRASEKQKRPARTRLIIVSEADVPVSEINAASESFAFLANEPEIYSIDDVKRSR